MSAPAGLGQVIQCSGEGKIRFGQSAQFSLAPAGLGKASQLLGEGKVRFGQSVQFSLEPLEG